jgi:hypothetical protein
MLLDVIRTLGATAAVFVAALLLISAAHKWRHRDRLTVSVATLTGLPLAVAPLGLVAAGTVEVAAAILMFLPATIAVGGMLAAGLWFAYLTSLVAALARGRRSFDCGCSFGEHPAPLGWFAILRNLTLMALALMVAAVPPLTSPATDAGALLGGFAFLTLYVAIDQIAALKPLANRRR